MIPSSPKPAARWPLYLVLLLLIIVTLVFIFEFVTSTETEMAAAPEATLELSPDSYLDQVTALLQDADPAHGAVLVEQYGCIACHRIGAANKIAPAFVNVADRAATRRPPLTPSAYIYESIVYPTAFEVEGFNPVMLQNFRERLSDRELGDIIAYLLTADAK